MIFLIFLFKYSPLSAPELVIERTKKWITEVVIGCNFCPFAANVVKRQTIYYQVASFHPLYLFEGSVENDPANYTNRSVYPMLHLLREESIDKALENYKDPESIPERNILFAREKGLAYMKTLRDAL